MGCQELVAHRLQWFCSTIGHGVKQEADVVNKKKGLVYRGFRMRTVVKWFNMVKEKSYTGFESCCRHRDDWVLGLGLESRLGFKIGSCKMCFLGSFIVKLIKQQGTEISGYYQVLKSMGLCFPEQQHSRSQKIRLSYGLEVDSLGFLGKFSKGWLRNMVQICKVSRTNKE